MTKKKNTQMEDAEKNLQNSASKFLSFQPKTKRDKELVDLVNSRLKELAVLDPEYALAMEKMIKKPLQEVQTKVNSEVKEQVAEAVAEEIPEEIQTKVEEEPIIETAQKVAESAENEEIYVPNDLDKITQEIVQKSEETAQQVEDEVSQVEEEIPEVPSEDHLVIESESQKVVEETEEEAVTETNEEPINEFVKEEFVEQATEESHDDENPDEGKGYPYDELEDNEESGLKKQIVKYVIFLVILCLAVFFLLRYCSTSKNKLTEQVAPEFISYGDTSKPKPVVEPKKEQPKKVEPKKEQTKEKAKAYDMKIEYSSADAAKKADAAAKKAEKEKAKQQAKPSTPKTTKPDTKQQGGEKKVTNDLTELESYKDKDERICTPDKVPSVGYVISYSSPKNEATAIKTVMILTKEQKVPCGYYWLGDSKTQSKKQLFRVYVGPYPTEAEAQSAMSKIQGLASDAKVYTEVK